MPVPGHLGCPWPSLTPSFLLQRRRVDNAWARLLTREHLQCCCCAWKETPGTEEESPFLVSQAWRELRLFLCLRWLGPNHPPKPEDKWEMYYRLSVLVQQPCVVSARFLITTSVEDLEVDELGGGCLYSLKASLFSFTSRDIQNKHLFRIEYMRICMKSVYNFNYSPALSSWSSEGNGYNRAVYVQNIFLVKTIWWKPQKFK